MRRNPRLGVEASSGRRFVCGSCMRLREKSGVTAIGKWDGPILNTGVACERDEYSVPQAHCNERARH